MYFCVYLNLYFAIGRHQPVELYTIFSRHIHTHTQNTVEWDRKDVGSRTESLREEKTHANGLLQTAY